MGKTRFLIILSNPLIRFFLKKSYGLLLICFIIGVNYINIHRRKKYHQSLTLQLMRKNTFFEILVNLQHQKNSKKITWTPCDMFSNRCELYSHPPQKTLYNFFNRWCSILKLEIISHHISLQNCFCSLFCQCKCINYFKVMT